MYVCFYVCKYVGMYINYVGLRHCIYVCMHQDTFVTYEENLLLLFQIILSTS